MTDNTDDLANIAAATVDLEDSEDLEDPPAPHSVFQRKLLVAAELSAIDVQLDFLKKEYEMIQSEIRELGKRSQALRNWTITLWSGSIAFAIIPTQGNIKSFVLMSAIFPFMFWLQDIRWLQVQRIFVWRGTSILRFVGSDALVKSIKEGVLVGHKPDGLRSDLDKLFVEDGNGQNFSSFWRVAFFQTNLSFYPVFIAASVVMHLYFNFDAVMATISGALSNCK